VAGSGTHEAELKAQAERLGLGEHGTFLGWIGDDALHSLYRIADLCVVPSIYEPFGLVALEAMASGCPCIVADTGGLREVVPPGERVGLRFNGGDAEHLGTMIERLLVDGELRDRLVAEASEHVLSFDWEDIARRTRGIYSELAPRHQGPQGQVRGDARGENPGGHARVDTRAREQSPHTKPRKQGVKRA
jgi:glycogen(starch) synthase